MKTQKTMIMAGPALLALALAVGGCATNKQAADNKELAERVAILERQVQQMAALTEPLKEQQQVDMRRKALREKFNAKMAEDRAKYTDEQLREAESLYQVANRQWGSPEATRSLETMIEKYPDINRTGCATLYVAQQSKGAEREKYLKQCIEKFGGCLYGDGVQVGAYARYLLADLYKRQGDAEKAKALCQEIRTSYPDAVDHGGKLLVDDMNAQGM